MKAKLAWLIAALVAVGVGAQGCGDVEEDEPTGPGPSAGGGTPTGGAGGSVPVGGAGGSDPGPKPPGGACTCDTDCEGDSAICLLGICMQRAQGACDLPNSELGCGEGFRCFNTDIFADTGICWPLYDETTCEGVKNRWDLCSPVRGDVCEPTCGSACTPDTVPATAAGSSCNSYLECAVGSDPMCYESDNPYDPSGWIQGYCLMFDCVNDAECGVDAGCVPAASDGSGVCMNTCGMDLDCRAGYVCHRRDGFAHTVCFAGCDAAATCPSGYVCSGGICVDENVGCSDANPYGTCPEGEWCDEGKCVEDPFICETGDEDSFEPNNTRTEAKDAPTGLTAGLTLCAGDQDWFRLIVPAQSIVKVGIEFAHEVGDLDFVLYDENGTLIGARYGTSYPYSYRSYETNTEYFGLYSEAGGDTYYLQVIGYALPVQALAQNQYNLHVETYAYTDGASCTDAGYTFDDCVGFGDWGSGLLPFPYADANDTYLGHGYDWAAVTNYRFARREMIMLIRYALKETNAAFPGTTPLSLNDISQIDGVTCGYDVDSPRHPATTHDQGGNIDVAYFQTDGANNMQIICGDGSVHADGFCSAAAETLHIVDLPRQAFFMAKLFSSPRLRVIGVDQIIGPLLKPAAQALEQLPTGDPQKITWSEYQGFTTGKMAYGSGWPYHHHHIHISLTWWSDSTPPTANGTSAPSSPLEQSMFRPDISAADWWFDPNAKVKPSNSTLSGPLFRADPR